MFGFVVGTLCLVGFVSVYRRRGWWRHGFHGWHAGRPGRFGRRGGWALYRAFEELDTSPGQEKAIRSALGEFKSSLDELRPDLRAVRRQVAQSLTAESFDGPEFEASLDRQVQAFGRVGPVVARTLGQVHEALDPDQRRRLAHFLEAGSGYC
jgi:uncharacterized membrane protein